MVCHCKDRAIKGNNSMMSALAAFLLAGVSGTIWHSLMTQRHLPTALHLVSHDRSCENLLVSWLPDGKGQTLVSHVCAWTPNLMPWWPGWIDRVGFERPTFSIFLKISHLKTGALCYVPPECAESFRCLWRRWYLCPFKPYLPRCNPTFCKRR